MAPKAAAVTVDLVEPIGLDILIYAGFSGVQIQFRIDGGARVKSYEVM